MFLCFVKLICVLRIFIDLNFLLGRDICVVLDFSDEEVLGFEDEVEILGLSGRSVNGGKNGGKVRI